MFPCFQEAYNLVNETNKETVIPLEYTEFASVARRPHSQILQSEGFQEDLLGGAKSNLILFLTKKKKNDPNSQSDMRSCQRKNITAFKKKNCFLGDTHYR